MITDIRDITSFKWATVTANNPLEIKLDGDANPLALIPDSLVDPLSLSMGDRVRVELSLRKVVVHGVANGVVVVESGRLEMTARSSAPSGWLLCHGQSLLRSSYPSLFLAVGTVYGSADSTHFNVPDMRGRVVVGMDPSQSEFNELGDKGGTKRHTLTEAELPSHSHPLTYNNNPQVSGLGGAISAGSFVNWFLGNNAYSINPGNRLSTASAGGGQSHNNLQPYIAVNHIIKI